MTGGGRSFPATLVDVLRGFQGEFVRLSLIYAISELPGGTLPIGRVLFVASDYVLLDHLIVDRRSLIDTVLAFIRLDEVQAVLKVRLEEIVLELGLTVEAGRSDGGSTSSLLG